MNVTCARCGSTDVEVMCWVNPNLADERAVSRLAADWSFDGRRIFIPEAEIVRGGARVEIAGDSGPYKPYCNACEENREINYDAACGEKRGTHNE